MNPIVRNVLAAVSGLIIGSVVNGILIMMSGSIIAPPPGADVTTIEGLKASMHLFEPRHFIMPFLAHALGTFTGALTAALVAANCKMSFALVIGCTFLLGGIINVIMLPSPLWYTLLDLVGAYIPFAYVGGKLALKRESTS